MFLNNQWWFNAQLHNHVTVNQVISVPMFIGLRPLLVPKFVLTRTTYWFMTCFLCLSSFALFVLFCLCAAVRWDSRVGYRGGKQHTLLLADGDCMQPILYYSGQQVKEVAEQTEEEEEEQTGEYTQQPVLLPFCMNVSKPLSSLSSSSSLQIAIVYNKLNSQINVL